VVFWAWVQKRLKHLLAGCSTLLLL
jgi:hypothetical protein